MEYTDFFSQYQDRLKKTKNIFESIDKQNKQAVSELFGLKFKGSGQKKKEALEDYFFQLMKAPAWQSYKIKVSENGTEILIKDSDIDDQYDAWEIIAKEAKRDGYNGSIKQDGDTVIYSEKNRNIDSKDDDAENDENAESNEEESQEEKVDNYELIRGKKGVYFFGSEERTSIKIDNATSQIDTYNWKESPLKWLFESPLKFKAESIAFDFNKGTILNVKNTIWEGNFKGSTFEGVYKGNYFIGRFYSSNKNFQAIPTAFVGGTFYDTTKTGLLGLDNITQGDENTQFNLIQIPVGYSIEILTDRQIRHTITVQKRLDEKDSNFSYDVYLGYDIDYTSPIKRTVAWEQIRQEYENYIINSNTKNIPNILTLQRGEQIVEIKVVKAGTPPVFSKKENYDQNKNYEDTIMGYKFNFDIDDEDKFDKFLKMKGYVNSSKFTNDLKSIAEFIDNNLITTSYVKTNFPYLSYVLNPLISKGGLSEVKLRGKKGGSSNYGTYGYDEDVFIGDEDGFKTIEQIEKYLNDKYSKQYDETKKRYPNKYYAERDSLIKKLFNKPSKETKVETSNVTSEVDEVSPTLTRMENFIKFYINRINAGDKTASIKTNLMNKIIGKNIDKFMFKKTEDSKVNPANKEKMTPQSTVGTKKTKGVEPKKPLKIQTEGSAIRFVIRKILSENL